MPLPSRFSSVGKIDHDNVGGGEDRRKNEREMMHDYLSTKREEEQRARDRRSLILDLMYLRKI